ncbi:uncharacterized protein J8A68_000287 [[Candida] subhashii]|uniref:UBX domain-containing protein n=1 Tax=[Candida] subhashii TaxID=561895 RepID=A0A8J5R7E8_9ASCO|nr:uncharacterized protein J8A68_000287 [[Candida] subhashii]KAG7666175.1 hypothetical protein J8A68_000287 [[Candida] subhashii]
MSSPSPPSYEELTNDQQESFIQFKSITGLLDSDNTDSGTDTKIIQLLTIQEFNLNNAISTYFDSGFDTINQPSQPIHTPTPPPYASGLETHNEEGEIHNRYARPAIGVPGSGDVVNLQSQMFMDSLLPKFPKAPSISNGWQLEVGIHSSIIHEREEEERKRKELEGEEKENVGEETTSIRSEDDGMRKKSPLAAIWILLLIIPKTVLQLLVSAFKFMFGAGVGGGIGLLGKGSSFNRLERGFNFGKFHPNYNFLNLLKNELVQEKEEGEAQEEESILNNYNVHDSEFNEVRLYCQKEYHWLLILLINDSIECQTFLKKLLAHPNFNKLFNKTTGSFKETEIFLNNVERSPEAFEIAHTYKCKRLPCIMLIGNVSASPELMASMSILYKSNLASSFIIEEQETGQTIVKILKNFYKILDKYNPQLVSLRFDKKDMEFSRMIRQQQDDAFLQSLEQDKLKKAQREQELQQENLEKLRLYYLLNLIKDNYFELVITSQPSDGYRIAIKLPNGKRIIELFDKSISINQFYLFVELKIYIEQLLETQQATFEEIINIIDELIDDVGLDESLKSQEMTLEEYCNKNSFKFEIIQPYPKKVIKSSNKSINDIPEFKGANFLVEFTDEDEEDDEESDE